MITASKIIINGKAEMNRKNDTYAEYAGTLSDDIFEMKRKIFLIVFLIVCILLSI